MKIIYKFIAVVLPFIIFFLLSYSDTSAAVLIWDGIPPDPSPAPSCPSGGDYVCIDQNTNSETCGGTVTTPDLTPCSSQGSTYQNTCCTSPGGCNTPTGTIGLWTYQYASSCTVKGDPVDVTACSHSYSYNSNQCGAQDRCDTPNGTGQGSDYKVYAGQCNPSCTGQTSCTASQACTSGGWYKSCCTGSETASNPTPQGTCNVIPLQQDCNPGTATSANVTSCPISSTPAPTPPPGCSGAPTGPGPGTVPGICDPAATSCTVPCTKTCTDNSGQTCAVTGQSVWACQGGTQWFNDGTCYASCPVSCNAPPCQGNQTRTTCGGACTLPR